MFSWTQARSSGQLQYLSETNSKLYTNFEFCEGKNHKHFKNTLIYKAKQKILTKKFKKNLHILKDGASGVQVSGTKQIIFLI